MRRVLGTQAPIERLDVSVYTVPTDFPEADGTIAWHATTMVLVEAHAGGKRGLGYTYAAPEAAGLIRKTLFQAIEGQDALDVSAAWALMTHAVRNVGRPGVAAMAISAVDTALWDLKARLLELPLVRLFGQVRECAPIYGSGGFTTYPLPRLQAQMEDWVAAGIPRVKMKIGSDPDVDIGRVRAVREVIGRAELFVDANGAYSRKQALGFADAFAPFGVTWFEEPVSSDDLAGLRLLRDRVPAPMDVAAGEYGFDVVYFRRMAEAGAVDVLQADATRALGFTGFLQADAVCQAFMLPLSAHCAPTLHTHVGCAAPQLRHLEYFHDHARIERMFFDGFIEPEAGALKPDLSRPGNGLELKRAEAARYAV